MSTSTSFYSHSTELQEAMEELRTDSNFEYETALHSIYRDENRNLRNKPTKNKRARRARIACKQIGYSY